LLLPGIYKLLKNNFKINLTINRKEGKLFEV
jgi:hypothetical protein